MRALPLVLLASVCLAQGPWDRVDAVRYRLAKFRDRAEAARSLTALGEAVRRLDPERAAAILRQAAEVSRGAGQRTFAAEIERAAHELSSNPEEAAAALERAAGHIWSFSGEHAERFAAVLLRLAREDPSRADRLFDGLVQELATDPAHAVPMLFAVANYVFGPPGEPFRIERRAVESGTVYNLRGGRPEAAERLQIAFLETAAAALRRKDDPLSVEFEKELGPHWPLLDGDPSGWLARFHRHWARRRVAEARKIASEVIHIGLRRRLDLLAAFSEGAGALAAGNTELAATVSARMPPGVHKALLHFGFGEPDWIFLGLREASEAGTPHSPGLLLIAARVLRETDGEAALRAFEQALEAFNVQTRFSFTRSAFFETVEGRTFTLTLDDVPGPDLAAAASELAPLDPDRVLSVLEKLRSEERLGPALVAAVVALISQGRNCPQTSNRCPRSRSSAPHRAGSTRAGRRTG